MVWPAHGSLGVAAALCLITGCVAVPLVAGHGIVSAVNASNRMMAAKMSFDSLRISRSPIKNSASDSATITGMVKWHPARRGETIESKSKYFALDGFRGVEVQLLDKEVKVVTSFFSAFRAWDGAEEVGALPPDKPVRFQMKMTKARNILAIATGVRIEEVVMGQSMATP